MAGPIARRHAGHARAAGARRARARACSTPTRTHGDDDGPVARAPGAPPARAAAAPRGGGRRPAISRGRRDDDGSLRAPRRIGPLPRILAAAAAGALAGAALARLGPSPPLEPAAGAALAAGAVLLLPRIGWLLAAAALLTWLAVPAPGHRAAGGLRDRRPSRSCSPAAARPWSLPAAAPLLGAIALAGAWPALAGQARRWPTRAALGALGGWWVGLAEALTSDRLVLGAPREVLGRAAWEGSAFEASQHALWPLVAGGGLGLAALWALAAVALPLLVRGRSAALDLVGVAAWAAALAAATQALSEALVLDPPRGLVAGALAGAVIAVGARAVRGRA